MSTKPKAYLDNNVVSAIAKDDTPAESAALDRLVQVYEQAKVKLVTSELTLQEIKPYKGTRSIERFYRLLEKVPIVGWDELLGFHNYGDRYTWISSPIIQTIPLYHALLALDLKAVDAQHVFVAARNTCEAFLTCDGGVLYHSAAIGKLCGGLVVQKPSDFVHRRLT
jgi:hypothetical protein